jgi:hypothetical protein
LSFGDVLDYLSAHNFLPSSTQPEGLTACRPLGGGYFYHRKQSPGGYPDA